MNQKSARELFDEGNAVAGEDMFLDAEDLFRDGAARARKEGDLEMETRCLNNANCMAEAMGR